MLWPLPVSEFFMVGKKTAKLLNSYGIYTIEDLAVAEPQILKAELGVKIYDDLDLSAGPASGSFGTDAMIIAPCSTNTLAKVANGISDTLITRAASVALKERQTLVLGVREMPFSTIALSQMQLLSSLGAIIAPPVLGYYAGIKSLQDMENFIIGKWLDALKIENNLYKRWQI